LRDKIVLVVGKSGSGKTTIVEKLEKDYGYKSISSYTTRKKRSEDEYGHIFITRKEFDELTDLVAYTEYNGNFYGATSQQVDENDLYVINPDGVEFFKREYKGDKKIIIVYIVTSTNNAEDFSNRYERMVARGDSYEEASHRVAMDNVEFRGFEQCADYIYVNDTEDAVGVICGEIDRLLRSRE